MPDFVITTTSDFDAGTKSNTATITDEYEGQSDAIALHSPPRKKDANQKGVWLMSEGSGTTTADSSGNGNTGTITGAIWTTAGKFGNALSFDGVDDLVEVLDSPSIKIGDAITLGAWVKPAGYTYGFVVGKGDHNYWIQSTPADVKKWRYGVRDPAGTYYWRDAVASMDTTAFQYIVMTFDPTLPEAERIKFFFNGAFDSQRSGPTSILMSIDSLYFSKHPTAFFNGVIDEVMVYNRALSSSEIAAMYNSGVQYHSSGNWKSAPQTRPLGKKLKDITITYSGISATYTLQTKILRASDDAVLWTGPVRTSGTTVTYTESDFGVITDDIKIQEFFAGDGNGTAVVTEISGNWMVAKGVLSPDGGEVWGVGQERDIIWDIAAYSGTITLSFSTAGAGGPYTTIASGLANTGHYLWRLMGVATTSSNCFVKAVGSTFGSDTSDASFIIENNWLPVTVTEKFYRDDGTLKRTVTTQITYDWNNQKKKETKTVS